MVVLEKNDVVGGAAVTEEFHPGFRNSVAAYTVSLLNPKVIADLELAKHGLQIVERPAANFWPVDDQRYLLMRGDLAERQAAIAQFSVRDAERLPAYDAMLERAADVLRDLVLRRRPTPAAASLELIKRRHAGPARGCASASTTSACCSTSSPAAPPISSTAGSRATSSRAPSRSTASSATTRRRRRRARPTCCCITASAR